MVFAFVPTLAALPQWLYFEAHNRLNLEEPVVLVFVPVRGVILLLNSFSRGLVQGVIAGVIDGFLMSVWLFRRGRVSSRIQRTTCGAICGALAALLMVLMGVAVGIFDPRQLTARPGAVAFEMVSGIVCGMIAAPTAFRLWIRSVDSDAPA